MQARGNVTWLLLAGLMVLAAADLSAQKRQRDVISREEIAGATHNDLYQVIRSIRPQFLEPPKGIRTMPQGRATDNIGSRAAGGSAGIAPLAVYVDGRRETGVDALQLIVPATVEEVRYLDPSRAENQFGISANGGAIVVKLRRGVPPNAQKDSTTG